MSAQRRHRLRAPIENDVSIPYDAFKHSEEPIRVAIAIHNGEDPMCGENGCLAKGRVVTPPTIDAPENLWSRTYNQACLQSGLPDHSAAIDHRIRYLEAFGADRDGRQV